MAAAAGARCRRSPTRSPTLVSLAEKARKEGLLALEAQVKDIDDPFLKRGLQMGIDGTDPEELRAVLEGEIAAKKAEDKVAAKFFNAMGGYAPTIGIIGTIVGLINVLENLSNPETLGPMIAAAFVATLWGVMAANFWFLPMGAKITARQRAAGRPDGAARRGHHRDPGRHQPARRPPEAHRARAAE